MKKNRNKNPIQPVSGTKVPRFAGPSTFARLPELRDVESCDVAIVGVPFDAGTSYRPGARFGPQSIRQASRHLRTNYHPSYDVEPFKVQQVADAGDITCNPFSIDEAIKQIEVGRKKLFFRCLHCCSRYKKVSYFRSIRKKILSSVLSAKAHTTLPFLSLPSTIMSIARPFRKSIATPAWALGSGVQDINMPEFHSCL